MSCPTCGHTMAGVGAAHGVGWGLYHCPRCGTLTGCHADGSACVPALVGRCRAFDPAVGGDDGEARWRSLGIEESIHPPGDRT